MHKIELEFKRIQTYLFASPRLRAMLGANATLGRAIRMDLPLLAQPLIAALAFAFATSLGEFGASLLISRPEFPTWFGSLEDARAFLAWFFGWYNHSHRHSGIGMHTPTDVHHGHADTIHEHRATVLTHAYTQHPERFVRHHPVPPALPVAAWINRPPHSPNSTTPINN